MSSTGSTKASTIELRIRINRYDNENAACAASNSLVMRNVFSLPLGPSQTTFDHGDIGFMRQRLVCSCGSEAQTWNDIASTQHVA
ncbi:hypothetical protein KSX_52660 [Ktedonospora formicarum]|uniref:Uncharacterized protein n=1 Tax=Ktedonospora formicarum TaxID=2778364 RepID=A0A8J3I791_9CHLR|nr:hypothetical protein KSX_52660 [Ktedonospora formicarum]